MNLKEIISAIEDFAPLSLQESFDNSGLLIGSPESKITSALICLDVTEEVISEAINKKCNLIISHHPLIFNGLKYIRGENEVQRCVALALKNDIAVYAAHTNLDNTILGVNGKIADLLGLKNRKVLSESQDKLLKLVTFVPKLHLPIVRDALFEAGAGHIGNYSSCSFISEGKGSFKAGVGANPFVGHSNEMHFEDEMRLEVILPTNLTNKVISSLLNAHPYEEPAYDLIPLKNKNKHIGSGLIGDLETEVESIHFLQLIKEIFKTENIRHTRISTSKIKKVAICGGSGSFLLKNAINENADIFISGDFKYHDFFEAENKIIIADVGHYESEQYTKELIFEIIRKKMPKFALQISEINTNPINNL